MSQKENISLKEQVAQLPLLPGCYLFENSKGEVIYVGKAKRLRNRVRSYFVDSREHSAKVKAMVRQIVAMRHIVVDSEADALLLENSLIKSLQPRYNILLKDDKSYPWILITNEEYPRVISTRLVIPNAGEYFGPYSSMSALKALLDFIRETIPLRTCQRKMESRLIETDGYSDCLQHHLGNCAAPCIAACSKEQYNDYVAMARSALKGDLRPVKDYLIKGMESAAAKLNFEEAAQFKARLDALDRYASHSVIVSAKIKDIDTFALWMDDEEAYCNFVSVRNGSIVAVHTATLTIGIEQDERALITLGIQHITDNIISELAPEVLVSHLPYQEFFPSTRFSVPQRGEKRKLLDFSLRSAKIARAERMKMMEISNPERHTERLMESMRVELRLERAPRHIECFDNSNLLGTNSVASCVVFRDGKPSRKEYRHFNIKSVVGADDFASMKEILHRRYSRLLKEGAELPDLIVVDGGKGQLSSAYSVLQELGLAERVPIVGLAKRLEEVFYPNDPIPYYLRRTGEPLKVLCHIRDEAHRFGITHHRNRRSKSFLKSELDGIKGVGTKSTTELLHKFRTVANIRKAPLKEVAKVVGQWRAERVLAHLNKSESSNSERE